MAKIRGMSDEEAEAWKRELKRERLIRVAERLRELIIAEGFGEGTLYDSVRVKGEKVVMDVPYAGTIEHGRKPGVAPPYAPIRRWVGKKFALTERLGRGKKRWKGTHMRRDEGKHVAWAIVKSIKKRGLPAYHLVERAWKQTR